MECTKYLITDPERRLKLALKYYNKSEEDLEEFVSIIEDWIRSEKYFPEISHRNVIKNFLLMNKFIIPKCKEKIQMYYSIRIIIPDFFQNKNPSAAHMQQCMDRIFYTPLPKVTEEGYRVCIIKVVDDNPDHFKLNNFFAHTFNISEIRLHEDVAMGDILVYDLGNLRIGHFLKMTPVVLKKTSIILEKVYSNRVKQIHFINTPQYASTTIAVIKQVMKAKMASRVKVHSANNHLCEYVSVNILPTDYGGTEKTLFELNELWKAKLLEYKERFDALDNMKICTKLIPLPLKNDEFLGFHGNFRKLDFD